MGELTKEDEMEWRISVQEGSTSAFEITNDTLLK